MSTDALAKFISTEATFERFVLENALSEKSTAMASSELADIRQKLDDIIHSDFKVYDGSHSDICELWLIIGVI